MVAAAPGSTLTLTGSRHSPISSSTMSAIRTELAAAEIVNVARDACQQRQAIGADHVAGVA